MKARLEYIGNSRGIRLPKPMIAAAGLTEEVDIKVVGDWIVLSSIWRPRAGWAEAAAHAHERDEDTLLDPHLQTRFDNEEWTW